MVDNAFLDKSIILGFIFLTDPHHTVCREYINSRNAEYYVTREVEEVYQRRRDEIISEHKRALFRHARYVTAEFEGELTSEDIEEIRTQIDRATNPAWRYLLDFYTDKEGEPTNLLIKDLRDVIHDFEQRADARKSELYERMHGWLRLETYEELRDKLNILNDRGEDEDLRIILDAHDVATHVEGRTELATANPKEFDHPEVRAVIKDHTNIDHVELIFVSRDYEPE